MMNIQVGDSVIISGEVSVTKFLGNRGNVKRIDHREDGSIWFTVSIQGGVYEIVLKYSPFKITKEGKV